MFVFYTPEDYEQFYGDPAQADPLTWREWLAMVVVGIILALAAGCDYQAAKATAEIIQRADEKKQELPPQVYFDNPLGSTWVLQAGNDAKGNQILNPRSRYSFAADLTKRTK